MTGNSNGTVALYDVGKGASKLERLKTHHQSGRAVNVVSFAGPSGQGTLLASGCQDGDIKLSVSIFRAGRSEFLAYLPIHRTFAMHHSSRWRLHLTPFEHCALRRDNIALPILSN